MTVALSPHQLLETHFGFREFLEGQEDVVNAIVEGHDALVIMPTGGASRSATNCPPSLWKASPSSCRP
jgi:ATP-dependent DNA helicase RecQ